MHSADIRGMGRLQRAEHAKVHHADMLARYAEQIDASVKGTVVITPHSIGEPKPNSWATHLETVSADTVSALFKARGRKVCVLNFASYRKPGGGFLSGSLAQEEALCHHSYLYEVLSRFTDSFYAENQRYLHRNMYSDRMLYTPKVVFEMDDLGARIADVLTCAAPNRSASSVGDAENTAWLERRINRMFTVVESMNVDTFIVGAWGCGVFGQSPQEVAELMAKRAKKFTGSNVIFAVPAGRDGNFQVFKNVLTQRAS